MRGTQLKYNFESFEMSSIGIGIVGGGYMGKAHSVAFSAVAGVFQTALRPRLVTICAQTETNAERYRNAYGFEKATSNWKDLISDPAVEAIVIASPQHTHHDIAVAALNAGKPVLCEKPLGCSLEQSRSMVAAAKASGVANMVGFNYIRTPASQQIKKFLMEGRIGDVTWFRGEMTEDFFADPKVGGWRSQGIANGTMGDLAPHMINAAHTLMGPIDRLCASVETVHKIRDGLAVTNDDQAQMMCHFENGAQGHMFLAEWRQVARWVLLMKSMAPKATFALIKKIKMCFGYIRLKALKQNGVFAKFLLAPPIQTTFIFAKVQAMAQVIRTRL